MEILPNGFTLYIPPSAFPLSTDSMALASFIRLPKNARVLDLGSGCGTLGLLLCAKDAGCTVTGVELDEASHTGALENIRRNRLENRMNSIWGDIRNTNTLVPAGSFSVCISNPPYFSGGAASAAHPTARREDLCSLQDLFRAAAWALQWGGDLYLVHRPERLAELCALGSANALEAKRLRLLRHKQGGTISLILLQFRKGGKPGLILDDVCLFEADGTPSPDYAEIYHI